MKTLTDNSIFPEEVIFTLSEKASELMTSESILFGDFFHPVFGSKKFPISYSTSLCEEGIESLLEELFNKRENFSLEGCFKYNEWLKIKGLAKVPVTLIGQCVGKDSGACKSTRDKWSCGGCGKSWLPGSYNSSTCKNHEFPFWFKFMKNEINRDMEKNGGVSNKAPLVWTSTECFRPFFENR